MQSQDLFTDCLGFPRQQSQSPGVYCRLEVNLGENSFKFETGNPGKFHGKFHGKRKSPNDYRRDQRRNKPPGNQGVSSAASGDPTKAQKGLISRTTPSSPPCSRTVPYKTIVRRDLIYILYDIQIVKITVN